MYLLIKYIKSVVWRVAKRLSLYRRSAVPKFNSDRGQVSTNIRQQDHSETGSMYCMIKCIVQEKQARVKNADLRHPSCTVVM